MTDLEFRRISMFLKDRYGIDMTHKKEIMDGRLSNMIRIRGFDSYDAYMNALMQDSSGEMEKELVNLLSTNHTYFMREFEHFEYMKKVVLPHLRKEEENTQDLRIWCGAASSGEEPYTLAMLLLDFFGLEHDKWDTTVLATDISTEVLQSAVRGVYKKEQIAELPDNWKRRFFRPVEDGEYFAVTDELKKEVLFRQFNLMDDFPFRKKLHVIFLRNVMIYFDRPTKQSLIKKLYDVLEPGGYLFVGRTETIEKGNVPFELVEPSIFRKPLATKEEAIWRK
ncbi:MAG: protein-glutamate O-methyltransferase CheR [Lachnospiraceae bacterium]|nr:protein-glutamate O-methyltransferase CheR [Lachnospiraceae bacterium]